MKFTNGYWLTKPEYEMNYAIESYSARTTDQSLTIICPCVPVSGRGDIMNHPTLTVTFSSPMEDIIRVTVEHFRGARNREPDLFLNTEKTHPEITEGPEGWTFRSGRASVRISNASRGWRVAFYYGDVLLTSSEYHGMASAYHKESGRNYMMDSLMLAPGECVYGLGERFTAYVKNGQTVDIWNGDGGTASELAYKNVPFYTTSRNYGVLVESSTDVRFEVASEKVERVQFSLEGQRLTYDLIAAGDPKGVIRRYTALTGRPALPPAWSFGLWLSTSFTTSYDEKTVTSFVDGMARHDIPLSVFHFDCFWMKENHLTDLAWDPEVFPDPAGFLRKLKDRGLHICCWINPYIAQASALFDEGVEKGYFLHKENGDVWQTDLWQPGTAILDVTNPEARKWFTDHLRAVHAMGVDAFKTDFGERIPVRGIRYFDGSDPLAMHNRYTYLYNRMVFETLEELQGKGNAVVFARSATIGGQQFPVHWNGDSSASYISMAETLRSGLSIAHSGFAFWSHDIAGFEQTASADVYKRWAAFGLLSSHSRLHGSQSYRVPWLFDEESCRVVEVFTKLKNRLMPYLYSLACEAHRTGIPVLRPMLFEFPEDPGARTTDMQYMLGNGLLVAPVFRADGGVEYYLPEGKWTKWFSGEAVCGGGWRKETHDFLSLPLLVRENTVIPVGAVDTRPDYDYTDGVELHVFEPAEGELSVTLPDLRGNPAATYILTTNAGNVTCKTDSTKPFTITVHRHGTR
ncbi:MAG: alpha-xylosidase [Clostridia bacterium]|nr:alpha-xylosidase [Clostridia bacterium]